MLVRSGLGDNGGLPILGDALRLTHVENRAAVMGISLLPLWVITLASLPALAFMLWWLWRKLPGKSWLARIMPWLVGGAMGNLFDRILFGQVTDMLDVDIPDIHWGSFHLERWWVFNLADSYIFVGMILIVILSFAGKLEDEEPPSPTDGPPCGEHEA